MLFCALLAVAAAAVVTAYSPWSPAADSDSGVVRQIGSAPTPTPSPSESESESEPSPPADRSEEPRADPPADPPTVTIPTSFPDETNTGVPDGVELRRSPGFDVVEDGAVIENLLIVDGSIEVWADNVTIRNVRISNTSQDMLWGILQRSGHSGLVVEDSEIYGSGDGHLAAGITNHGGMITIRRVEIHTVSDAINTETGLLEANYLHSPAHVSGDHNDMVQANGGPVAGHRLEIRGNTIINDLSQTGAISLFANFSEVRNVEVVGNFLAGGGYTVYGGGLTEDGRSPANVVFRDNVFSRHVFPDGGFYGPVAHFDQNAPGNVWSGNVWEDGSPVRV